MVAVTLQTDADRTPDLGGVVRALASPSQGQPVRLVFEGRSPARLPCADAQAAASELLTTISVLIAEDEPIADVA